MDSEKLCWNNTLKNKPEAGKFRQGNLTPQITTASRVHLKILI